MDQAILPPSRATTPCAWLRRPTKRRCCRCSAARPARPPGAGRRAARRAFWRRPDRARAALFHRARMGTRRAGRALAAHEGRPAPRSTRARARRGRVQPMKPLAELDARGVKALLFDIDDTLTTEGKLTAQAYDALHRLRRAGQITVPVTGRPAGRRRPLP